MTHLESRLKYLLTHPQGWLKIYMTHSHNSNLSKCISLSPFYSENGEAFSEYCI